MLSLSSIFKKKYPVILPAKAHSMTEKLIERDALDVLRRLRNAGFDTYLVGGCVRDILLGRKVKDFDVVTSAYPRQIKRLFKRCYLIGRRFRLAHVYVSHDRFYEVSTFRALVEPGEVEGGRYAENNVFGTIGEDALRRDFTINALYYNGADSSIVDYTGGLSDLRKKVLRSIGDPEKRFREDPVRIIRAGRFCAQLGFELSRKDARAAAACAPLIKEANANRMIEELYKILRCGASRDSFINFHRFGLLEHWIPELSDEKHHAALLGRLAALDKRRQAGEEIAVSVLITTLLFDLLHEAITTGGGQTGFHEAFTKAHTMFQEMATRMKIPRREWDKVCTTAARFWTLSAQAGGRGLRRSEKRFVRSEYFRDALLFFEIVSEATGEHIEQLAAWKRRMHEAGPPEAERKHREQPGHGRDGGRPLNKGGKGARPNADRPRGQKRHHRRDHQQAVNHNREHPAAEHQLRDRQHEEPLPSGHQSGEPHREE